MKYWDNANGSGNLFNLNLSDSEDGTQMLATFYHEAADHWFQKLDEGREYLFSGGLVKKIPEARKKYSAIKHDYMLTFTLDCDISLVNEDEEDQPAKEEPYTLISELDQFCNEP